MTALRIPLVPRGGGKETQRDELVNWAFRARGKTQQAGSEDLSGATWSAWQKGEQIAIDIYVEHNSICIATILFQRTAATGPDDNRPNFFAELCKGAQALAEVSASHYRRLWEKVHSVKFNASVMGATLPEHRIDNHWGLYPEIAKRLNALIRHIAGSLQSPIAGMFIPDFHEGIFMVGHVGYDRPPAYRVPRDREGVSRTFCLSRVAGRGDRSEQIATREELDGVHRKFKLPPFSLNDDDALQSAFRDRFAGPWVYTEFELDQHVWGDIISDTVGKPTLCGVFTLRGRIPHQLDRHASPQFTQFELRRLQDSVRVLGLVFQRFIRAFEQSLTEHLLSGASASLLRSISEFDVTGQERAFDEFTQELMTRFQAKCVLLCSRNNASDFKVEGLAYQDEQLANEVKEKLRHEIWGKGSKSGHLFHSNTWHSRYFLALCRPTQASSNRMLAIVGVRNELEWPTEVEPRNESAGFPRLLERGIRLLEVPTLCALDALASLQRVQSVLRSLSADLAPSSTPDLTDQRDPETKLRPPLGKEWTTLVDGFSSYETSFKQEVFDFILELIKFVPRAQIIRDIVGRYSSTGLKNQVEKFATKFYGEPTSWKDLMGERQVRTCEPDRVEFYRETLSTLARSAPNWMTQSSEQTSRDANDT